MEVMVDKEVCLMEVVRQGREEKEEVEGLCTEGDVGPDVNGRVVGRS
jgi:hypothetical protein